jgi:chemotaxis protein MotB
MIRRRAASRENHERWLVSYADFITLLFAFFVVMFATTQSDRTKAREVAESVRDALEHGEIRAVLSSVLGRGKHAALPTVLTTEPTPPVAQPANLSKYLATLEKGLDAELRGGKVEMKLENRGLVISLREATFFASGDDSLAPASIPILAKIVAIVQGSSNPIRLEGHTDSVPIHNSRFRSNWELSTARGIAVLELLNSQFQIPTQRMAVAGYAENAPADTNETEEGRAHNRRVDLVLLTETGQRTEPPAPAAVGTAIGN